MSAADAISTARVGAGKEIRLAAMEPPAAMARRNTFELKPLPPFRLDLTAWALRRRPENHIDRWDDGAYRRALFVGDRRVEVTARQTGSPEDPLLEIQVSGPDRSRVDRAAIASALTRALGLQTDLEPFYRMAGGDPALGPLVAKFRGLKPPRLPSVFETLVNAIACQQLSLTVGLILLGRLAEKCFSGARFSWMTAPPFPRPADVVRVTPRQLRAMGFSRQKSRAIRGIATSVEAGKIDLEAFDGLGDDDAFQALRRLHGIGRWSAEYVLLRGLGRLSVFPGDDVGGRKNLERWLKLRRPLDYEGVRRRVRRWQPYAGFIYFHLLLQQLADRGYLH